MAGSWLFLLFLLSTNPSQASGLRETFSSLVQIKRLQEKIDLNKHGPDLEPGSKEETLKGLSAALTEARIHLHEASRQPVIPLDHWEASAIANLGKKHTAASPLDPSLAIQTLKKNFPDARSFSALEWAVIEDWFGKTIQQEFIKHVYGIKKAPENPGIGERLNIVFVKNPFQKLLNPKQRNGWEKLLETQKKDLSLETIEVTAFAGAREQAEELVTKLKLRSPKNPYILVTSEDTSAVMNKMLDLYPQVRTRKEILAWINLDGRLFGLQTQKNERHLASSPPAMFESQITSGLHTLRFDRLERQTPLGQGFPILNLITANGSSANLTNRDSLIPEGETWILEKGASWPALRNTIEAFYSLSPK